MKKSVFALITCVAVAMCAGCGSGNAGTNGKGGVSSDIDHAGEEIASDAGNVEPGKDSGAENAKQGDVSGAESAEVGDSSGAEILVQIEDPEIEVTAEEFADMMGFTFMVPDDATDVTYIIDTGTGRGTMGFYLGDVLWNARVMRHDTYLNIEGDYVGDNMEEIRCDFASDPAMTVRGVDPTYVKGYRIQHSEDWEAYMYKALWFLEDEGYIISLANYSETPVDAMPVEVFQ